jgi:rhomboid protease GluP
VNENDPIVACAACGAKLPRSEMFGVEPDLNCPNCAAGVRKRMHVRYRPRQRDRAPYVTVFLLVVSIALFVFTHVLYPGRGGAARPAWLVALFQAEPIWVGEVWRHATCMVLHGAWWHILMNCMALWFLGRAIELGWGHLTLVGLMLGTGLVASAAEWIMQGGGIGLSGGLFGLCGFLWALRRVHPIAAAVMNEQQIRWILTLLVIGVVLSATGQLAIGNWAHGGGLVSGYLIGMAARDRRRFLWLPVSAVGVALLVVLSVYVAFGKVELKQGDRTFKSSRAEWREYWIEHYADR